MSIRIYIKMLRNNPWLALREIVGVLAIWGMIYLLLIAIAER